MADQIRATPQNATLGAIANFLKQTYAPQRTQQMQGVMELLGVPALARTAERMSYGEPVTNINKANVPLLPADTAEAAMLAGPPLASMARRVGTNLVQTAPYVARDLAQSMTSPMRSYVVKPKGGNWLAGSVERAVEPMKRGGTDPAMMEILRNADPRFVDQAALGRLESESDAMNRWLETKLGKYMRNEMATPEDPVRALADRGVTHIPGGVQSLERVTEWIPETLEGRRAAAGFPRGGMSQTPYGQGWEQLADEAIHNMPARMRINPDTGGGSTKALQVEQENPWLMKVPPDTMTYGAYPVEVRQELGFEHLVDELRNAINPASGLPENLRWKYSDLDKVTVPQAVERVAKINDWRAAQKAEADMARAMGPATQVVKEYPEQGFKWVELRQPENTGKKATVERSELDELGMGVDDATLREVAEEMAYDEGLEEGTRAFDDFVNQTIRAHNTKTPVEVDESVKALEDALKYEGETMGHCVGGYCPDVVEGRSKIYSLRDKKGQPHVTIEVAPRNITVEEAIEIAKSEGLPEKGMETFNRVAEIMGSGDFMRQDIVQIKGKANRAPKEEYLPAVQDFIRSGNFGKVGDLGNTRLIDVTQAGPLMKALQDIYGRDMGVGMDKFNAAAEATPDAQRFMTKDELLKFLGETPPEGLSNGGAVRGYKAGGAVRSLEDLHQRYAEGGEVSGANFPTDDFDPARIDAIVGELHALNAG